MLSKAVETLSTDDFETLTEYTAAYIERTGGVTFAELEKLLRPHIEVEGNDRLVHEADENLLLWMGMSEQFIDIVDTLLSEKRVYPHATAPLVYIADGRPISLPVATEHPDDGYETPHWLPVSLGPQKEHDGPAPEYADSTQSESVPQ